MPTRFEKAYQPNLVYSLVGVVIIVLFLLELAGATVAIRSGSEKLIKPLQTIAGNIVFLAGYPGRMIHDAHQSHQKIQDLEFGYARALARVGELQALQAENQALKELIENTNRTLANSLIGAPVVSYGAPLINVGAQDGVSVGNPILVNQILVGRVAKVSPSQSEVTLLTQVNAGVILAKTESGVTGVIKGDGRRILLTEVPSDESLVVGQLLTTAGQDGVGRDLVIGTIASVKDEPSAPTQTAVINQVVSFFDARVVEVRLQ